MSKKKTKKVDALETLTRLLEKTEGVQLKGAKNKYSAVNGNMFCFLASEHNIALRLSKQERADFLEKHPDCVCISYNTVMKDYVVVPDSIMTNNRKLNPLWKRCIENAFSLEPKPTTKSGKKKVKKKPAKKRTKKTKAKATKNKMPKNSKKKAKESKKR